MSKLKDEPNTYALAFHVDYWNGSWTDRFSSASITARQRKYGFGTYTPQLVVDGAAHVLGSDEAAIRDLIKARGNKPAPAIEVEGNKVTWSLDGIATPDAELLIALTEDGITSKVTAGENAGETFVHDAVVRAYSVVAATAHGSLTLSVPGDVNRSRAKVIAILQRPHGEVLAVSGSPASPRPSSKP